MSKKIKILLSIGITAGVVATIIPLSIIAAKMITSDTTLKLKSVKENGTIGDSFSYSNQQLSNYPTNLPFPTVSYYYLTLTFNHSLSDSQGQVEMVTNPLKYDDGDGYYQSYGGKCSAPRISQNHISFFVYSDYCTLSSDANNPPSPPAHRGGSATEVYVAATNQSTLSIELLWTWTYKTIEWDDTSSSPTMHYTAYIAESVIPGVTYKVNPLVL